MTLKTHIADKEVAEAERTYEQVRQRYEELTSGPLTPRRVVSQVELHGELEQAAREVEEARQTRAEVAEREAEEKRVKARKELAKAESELVTAATKAENLMAELAPLLLEINILGKRRYGLKTDVTGRAQHVLLPTGIIVAWLRHRLAELGSTDLGRPHRHQRGSLADLLALPVSTDTEEVVK